MGPKGKGKLGTKGKPTKQVKGRKEEGEKEDDGERARNPQPVVDIETMDTGSNHEEEEEEQVGQDDEGETGKQMKEKYEYDAIVEQKLVEFFSENDCLYNKGSEKYANTKYKKRLLENLAKELNTTGE